MFFMKFIFLTFIAKTEEVLKDISFIYALWVSNPNFYTQMRGLGTGSLLALQKNHDPFIIILLLLSVSLFIHHMFFLLLPLNQDLSKFNCAIKSRKEVD